MVERRVQGPLLSRGYGCYPNPVPAAPFPYCDRFLASGTVSGRAPPQDDKGWIVFPSWRDLGFFNPRCVYIFIHPVSDSLCSAVLVPNSSLRHGQATGTHALVSPLLHSKWQSPTASASTYSDHRSEDYEEDACSEPSTDGRSIGRCTASINHDCKIGRAHV